MTSEAVTRINCVRKDRHGIGWIEGGPMRSTKVLLGYCYLDRVIPVIYDRAVFAFNNDLQEEFC